MFLERGLFGLALLIECATLVSCCLLQRTPLSLLAPVLGPWAGVLYGHHDCTLGNLQPLASWTLLGALPLAAASLYFGRDTRARPFALLALVLVIALWSAFALLSVLNTTS